MANDIRCSRNFEIPLNAGVPLREVARFVGTALRYSCAVIVRYDKHTADGKSLFQMASLRVTRSPRLTVTAWGEDAEICLTALTGVVDAWASQPWMPLAA